MPGLTVVILAAGQGTRMRSQTPKVLHDLCGRPLLRWPIAAALEAGAEKIVVVDSPRRALEGHLPDGVALAVQAKPNGTGGAVQAGMGEVQPGATVVVLHGDVPLVTADTIAELVGAHSEQGVAATMVTMVLEDPTGYGRVVRDAQGAVEAVVETKQPSDATAQQLAINEVNAGVFAFDGDALREVLGELQPHGEGELYLPDVLPALRATGRAVAAHPISDNDQTLGVNDRVQLVQVRAVAQARMHAEHGRNGVTIVDPGSTVIEVGVQIGEDTVVEPSSFVRGSTSVGRACRIGPLTTLVDATIGDAVKIPHSYLTQCEVRDGAHLRELDAVVDAERLIVVADRMRGDGTAGGAQGGQDVGQIELALAVWLQLDEHLAQGIAVEGEDPGVDLVDRQLPRCRVGGLLGLDDGLDAALRVADDAAVGRRVLEHHRDHRRGGPPLAVRPDELGDRVRRDQRHVAVQHDDGRARLHLPHARLDRATGAVGLRLHRQRDAVRQLALERPVRRIDDDDLLRSRLERRRDRPPQQRAPAEVVQDLRRLRAHAGTPACGEDQDGEAGHARILRGRLFAAQSAQLLDGCSRS